MPVILITPIRWSRSPIQAFFLFLLAVAGILVVLGLSENILVRQIGPPWSGIWGAASTIGSTIALIGAYWKNQVTGMIIERAGISLLGLAALYWLATVFVFTKADGLYTEIMTALFILICYLQVRYINIHINLILDAINHGGKFNG